MSNYNFSEVYKSQCPIQNCYFTFRNFGNLFMIPLIWFLMQEFFLHLCLTFVVPFIQKITPCLRPQTSDNQVLFYIRHPSLPTQSVSTSLHRTLCVHCIKVVRYPCRPLRDFRDCGTSSVEEDLNFHGIKQKMW